MPATYENIATTTLSSAASTITFSSIPNTYTDLRLVFNVFVDAVSSISMRINGDTGSNYSETDLFANGTTVFSTRETSQTQIWFNVASTLTSGTARFITLDAFSYAGSTNKTFLYEYNGDVNTAGRIARSVALWRSTSAITSLSFICTSNFATGTTATLYGIKSA